MIYILIGLLLLSFIYQFDIQGYKTNRGICYNLVLVILTILAGMRYCIGADTVNYLYHFYHDLPHLEGLTIDDFAWDAEPLWVFFNSVILSLGGKWFIVQFIQAAFVHYLLFRYFKKHSNYIFTCVFFYFIWMYTYYVTEELRASMSVVLCLCSNDYFGEKKWGKGYLLLIIGCLFHKSTYLLLIIPMFVWLLRSNLVAAGGVVAAFISSYILKSQMSDYLYFISISDSIDDKIDTYVNSDIYGEMNGNINFFLVHVFPFLFYPILSLYYNKNKDIVPLKPWLFVGFIFIVISFNINIFYRYVHFYMPYIIIFVSQLFIDIFKREKDVFRYKNTTHIGLAMIKIFILFTPLFVLNGRSYKEIYTRYYPYSSIIECSIPLERRNAYMRGYNIRMLPQPNQY